MNSSNRLTSFRGTPLDHLPLDLSDDISEEDYFYSTFFTPYKDDQLSFNGLERTPTESLRSTPEPKPLH
ncbi:unnamed protein product [Bursaphelenchus okinawaensis]|uniref:Uncharacterized protein n=1 Tax=Bursaphelenchus okinawaensis TaxID=465554 RepID=A0A811JR16_9BILA|nr:unnamed protein product [Bursaphelenchus okinawaensis]CAG9078923.1 unnamed protein product [Bursaphelenchus okinawaensis]